MVGGTKKEEVVFCPETMAARQDGYDDKERTRERFGEGESSDKFAPFYESSKSVANLGEVGNKGFKVVFLRSPLQGDARCFVTGGNL